MIEIFVFKVVSNDLTCILFVAEYKHDEIVVPLSFIFKSLLKFFSIMQSIVLDFADTGDKIFDAIICTVQICNWDHESTVFASLSFR